MKKTITIIIIALVVIGVGIWLFKISPSQQQANANGYNSLINASPNVQTTTTVPAFNPAVDHYMGNASSTNVFIEYGDLQCPACQAVYTTLNQVSTKFPNTVFVYRYFPLIQLHQNTVEASLAAEAANAQGSQYFWKMHDIMYANQTDWADQSDPLNTFVQYAQQIGVPNMTQFKNDITNKTYLSYIQNDYDQATALQLTGTPTLFINGHQLENTEDINQLLSEAQPYLK